MNRCKNVTMLRICIFASLALCVSSADAQQLTSTTYQTNVNVEVMPIAQLSFIGSPQMNLVIPPAKSTIPSAGVRFVVNGNASASLIATPSAFIDVPDEGYMGKAVQNGEEVGYKVQLRFPRIGVAGSAAGVANLPGGVAGPAGPLSVNLNLTGGSRQGEVHMEAAPNWTASGNIPLPGVYAGNIILTLTADY